MNIALLGGAFNPPHNGHLMIAQQVLDFTDTGEVWFLPNYGQIPAKRVAPVADRVAMAKLLVLPKTRVSTIEIDNELDGETVHLLPFLPKEHTFSFVIGSDQLPGFTTWLNWEQLLASMTFWVFPRPGSPTQPLHPGMKVITHELLIGNDISSTRIRERIAKGLPIDQFMPLSISQYIGKSGLYQ